MYSLKNALKQSPEEVKGVVLVVLAALVVVGVPPFKDVSAEAAVAVGAALERVLNFFYVKPVQAANLDNQALQGIQLGKDLKNLEMSDPPVTASALESHVKTFHRPANSGPATDEGGTTVVDVLVTVAIVFLLIVIVRAVF